MTLCRGPFRSIAFQPARAFSNAPSLRELGVVAVFRKRPNGLRSRGFIPLASTSPSSSSPTPSSSKPVDLEEAFEPKYGLPVVREKLSYGELLKEIRLQKIKEIHWLTAKNDFYFEGICLVEYKDGRVKQSVVPAHDMVIPSAMTANRVVGSLTAPVPSEIELRPVAEVDEKLLGTVAKVFPAVSLLFVYIGVQYMNWLKGDMGDRLKMKEKQRDDERREKDEIKDEAVKGEAEELADMGLGVKEIVKKLRASKIEYDLYRIKQLVDRAQLKAKKEEEEMEKQRLEAASKSKMKDGKQSKSDDQPTPRQLRERNDSDDQTFKMLTLDTLQVIKPRRKERNVHEEEESRRKMRQLTRKMKSRGMKLQYTEDDRVYFDDVAGVGNAKFEVMEVVDFFVNSFRFRHSGARIPRGVLLCGPPGCGKTMLARAVAGEAGVNFLCVNASEFVEMFIGVGASRVRDLFAEARKNAPCIVFIDEIDAVGRIRGGSMGNDERDQTVNQLLSEMDGFNRKDADVVVMAATNRRDVLDLALIRPGRFDRIINVPLPDLEGRVEILETYLNRLAIEGEINVREIAFEAQRYSGAALANLINTACIFAGRVGRSGLRHEDLIKALDYERLGPGRPPYSDGRQKRLAVHEASTCLVATLMPSIEPIVYVTIVPREKNPMGQTVLKVNANRELTQQFTQRYLSEQLLMVLASRAGEEIFYGLDEMSTINQRKIAMARRIVQKLLISDNMEIVPGVGHQMTFAARQIGRSKKQIGVPWTTSQKHEILDTAMIKRLNEAYEESKQILLRNKKALSVLVSELMAENTLRGDQVSKIIEEHANKDDLRRLDAERCDFM